MKKIFFYLLLALTIFFLLESTDILTIGESEPVLRNPEELTEISNEITDFSFQSFSSLVSSDVSSEENLFISPYSIYSALGIAYLGADGETKKEMEEVLLIKNLDNFERDNLELKKYLEHISENTEVNIANSLFLRKEIPFRVTFEEKAKTYFQAEIDQLPAAGKDINNWVSEETNGKINELVDPGPISDLTVAYLINAIYFKAGWDKEFDADKTTEKKFYGVEEKDVDMMEAEEEYQVLNQEDLKAIKIDYKDGNYSFYGFMPQDLDAFRSEFNKEKFQDLKERMNRKDIIFRMPKFTLEDKLNLNETLKSLGIKKAFESSEADFSKMVEEMKENVYINKVLHSSFIEVDEEGTEAAAATSVEMKMESVQEKEMIEFNRPFLFLIEENNTNTVLFIGQLVNP